MGSFTLAELLRLASTHNAVADQREPVDRAVSEKLLREIAQRTGREVRERERVG
jgi:hypothetical protein